MNLAFPSRQFYSQTKGEMLLGIASYMLQI